MQVLYQLDIRGEVDAPAIREGLADGFDPPAVVEPAYALACAAWEARAVADALVLELAPDWPTYRQPPVDRAILRLAYHEITSGHAPMKVAINEAVQLAKEYSTEHSAPFVNGVLDKLAKRLPAADPAAASAAPIHETPPSAQAWLRDAMQE